MKIRTRLLLFLLPTLIGSITLVSTLLAYNLYHEIIEGFKTRLKTAVVATAAMIDPEEIENQTLSLDALSQTLHPIQEQLEISDLYFLSIHSPLIASIPKDVHITSPYSKADGIKRMTGYAPIYDKAGHLMGLMAADVKVDLIEKRFQDSLFLILLTAGATLIIMIVTLFAIANRISRPVQKLNNSALAIAAGQYGESIQVDGPKEIAELANTLNTMSECLLENINRLQENSLLREKMYGEYECAMLLQHLMLQKNIDNCRSDAITVKSITFFSDYPWGLLLDFPKSERADLVQIHLAEAQEEGFEGMYQLVAQYKFSKEIQAHTSIQLDRSTATLSSKGPSALFVWSLSEKRFMPFGDAAYKVESGDLFFLWNQGLSRFYKGSEKIGDLLAKVLKVFAQDGLETTVSMLHKEIAFATKRKKLEEDIHLLCFQVLNV